tara:strand:- start:724 stop:1602 length:879 start_codon:yes stop_codon:yes gene_type:complete
MNYHNADSSGNDIHVITDVVTNADTAGWYYGFMLWGKWNKSQIFYNQNPPINAMDTHIDEAMEVHNTLPRVNPALVTGTKERLTWFINVSKMEKCYHYQSSQNQNTVEGLTADNIKITEDIKPEPFKVGSYEVTQEMIDENPDAFKTVGLNDELMSAGVYDMHPEVKRLANQIFDIYRPHCEEIVGRKFKKEYTNGYLNRNAYGDSVWTHADPFDYTLVVYLNPDAYDLRKWGGETIFLDDSLTFCRGGVSPKGSTACLFKSDIPHKVTGVSWEAEFDRMAITYYLEFDDVQ